MAWEADIAFNDITIAMKNSEPYCKYGYSFSGNLSGMRCVGASESAVGSCLL